jgi:4-amino-4-deoxy-L-arabinose transferase-like glycosyltransferase
MILTPVSAGGCPMGPIVFTWMLTAGRERMRTHYFWLIIILLLAAGLRLWQLGEMPPGLYHDEAYNGLDALSLMQGKQFPQFYEGWELYYLDAHGDTPPTPTRRPVFFEGNYGREPLHIYLMALSIRLFGPTPFAVRLVPALAGVLAVLTTYLAATVIVPRQKPADNCQLSTVNYQFVPLLAAFFLAIIYPAVHFSRFGIRPMLFLPLATLAIYCFWRGVDEGRSQRTWPWFAVTGFFIGLSLYSYASARLFPLLFIAFLPFWLWHAERALWRRHLLNLGLMGGVAFLTALPLLLFFWRYPYYFIFRASYVATHGAGVVEGRPFLTRLLNVGRVIGGLFWQGETHLRHNLPGRPFLDPIQSLAVLAGTAVSLRRLFFRPVRSNHLRLIFLFLWLGVMLLPSILSGDAPHFGRISGAAPPLAILAAIGVGRVFTIPYSVFSKKQTAYWLLITVYCLLLTSLFLTTRDYFGRYASRPQLAHDFHLPDWELGQMAAAQSAATMLYLTPTQEEMATIYFALADPARLHSYTGAAGAVPAGRPDAPALYFIRPQDKRSQANLSYFFPGGEMRPPAANFIPFYLPATAPRIPDGMGETADFGQEISLQQWEMTATVEHLAITLYWQAQTRPQRNYTAFVHLLNEAGEVVAQQDRPPAGYPTGDWVSGEVVIDQYRVDLPPDLPSGDYWLQTGFYYLPTLERLGTAVTLTAVRK